MSDTEARITSLEEERSIYAARLATAENENAARERENSKLKEEMERQMNDMMDIKTAQGRVAQLEAENARLRTTDEDAISRVSEAIASHMFPEGVPWDDHLRENYRGCALAAIEAFLANS